MGKGIFALESIDYQGNAFLEKIAEQIVEIRKDKYISLNIKELYTCEPIKEIVEIIKITTGLSVNIGGCSGVAAAYIPLINNNNILISEDTKNINSIFNVSLEKDIINLSKKLDGLSLNGKIDLNKGYVSGVYTKLQFRLLINKYVLTSKKYSEYEVASILIHEIGHLFTHIEYNDRTTTTNQVLSLALKVADSRVSAHTREIVYSNLKNNIGCNKEEEDILINNTNKDVISVLILNKAIEKSKSELGGVNVYDSTSCEQLADNFATMHGCGKHLVTANEKAHNYGLLGKGILTIVALPFIIISPILAISAFSAYCVLLMSTMDGKNAYDNTYSRYSRIKHDNIQIIKDKETEDIDRNYLIEQNVAIDSILNTYSDNKNILQFITYWAKPGYKKAKDYEDLQKGLEKLTNNDLFTSAEILKQL